MASVGVCLSGCGVFDGAEIHESVLTILALDQAGADIVFLAPSVNQTKVVNHLTGNEVSETRNVLVESARIARGPVTELTDITDNDIEALIFPGGFGAALNLCSFGQHGANCTISPEVEDLIQRMVKAGKPVGAFCIAPAMLARALRDLNLNVQVTIGSDPETARQIELLGARHIECPADDIVVDENRKIVSTPAYMLGKNISQVSVGITKAVNKVLELI